MKNKKNSQKNKLVDSKGVSGKFKIIYLSIALVFMWLFTFFTYTQGENFITFLLISIFFTSILIPIIFHIKKNDKTFNEPINFQKIQKNIMSNIRVDISKKKIKDTEIIRENNREGFLNNEYEKTFLIIRWLILAGMILFALLFSIPSFVIFGTGGVIGFVLFAVAILLYILLWKGIFKNNISSYIVLILIVGSFLLPNLYYRAHYFVPFLTIISLSFNAWKIHSNTIDFKKIKHASIDDNRINNIMFDKKEKTSLREKHNKEYEKPFLIIKNIFLAGIFFNIFLSLATWDSFGFLTIISFDSLESNPPIFMISVALFTMIIFFVGNNNVLGYVLLVIIFTFKLFDSDFSTIFALIVVVLAAFNIWKMKEIYKKNG